MMISNWSFDYYCLINGESCLLGDSQGQDCSFGEVYLVDKDLAKKWDDTYNHIKN